MKQGRPDESAFEAVSQAPCRDIAEKWLVARKEGCRHGPDRSCNRAGRIESSESGSVHRVWSDVGGEPLWFETSDCSLLPSVEGFACALLLASLERRARLHIRHQADPVWTRNIGKLVRTWHGWWDLPLLTPAREGSARTSPARKSKNALCFTGGLDSFHSLLYLPRPPDVLVFIHGYDVPLDDSPRAKACVRSLKEIAAATGAARGGPYQLTHALHFRPAVLGTQPWQRPGRGRTPASRTRRYPGDFVEFPTLVPLPLGHALDDRPLLVVQPAKCPSHRGHPFASRQGS